MREAGSSPWRRGGAQGDDRAYPGESEGVTLINEVAEAHDCGDVQRLDVGDLANAVFIAPFEEPAAGPVIRHAGVPVADRRGEEFQEAGRHPITRVGRRPPG